MIQPTNPLDLEAAIRLVAAGIDMLNDSATCAAWARVREEVTRLKGVINLHNFIIEANHRAEGGHKGATT